MVLYTTKKANNGCRNAAHVANTHILLFNGIPYPREYKHTFHLHKSSYSSSPTTNRKHSECLRIFCTVCWTVFTTKHFCMCPVHLVCSKYSISQRATLGKCACSEPIPLVVEDTLVLTSSCMFSESTASNQTWQTRFRWTMALTKPRPKHIGFFSLRGHLKNEIFVTPPATIEELKRHVTMEIQNIIQEMLRKVFQNIMRHAVMC